MSGRGRKISSGLARRQIDHRASVVYLDTDARGYFKAERRCAPLWAGSQSFVSPSLARTYVEYGSVRCELRRMSY